MNVAPAAAPRGLGRFVGRPPSTRPGERCEMCAAPLAEAHAHVVNLESRKLLCSCRACYLLFVPEGAGRGKYRAVPERVLYDPTFQLTAPQWDRLQIPVRLAFFFFNSALGRTVAFYPGPAGATESLLPLDAWRDLAGANPIVGELHPDIEALLVYGRRDDVFACFLAPIDACYQLTGLVKRSWKGFDGGEQAWSAIEAFFADLRARSREVGRRE